MYTPKHPNREVTVVTPEDFTHVKTQATEPGLIEYTNEEPVEVVEEFKPPLPGPQEDPAFKRAKAIMEYRMKMDAQRAKETKCCKSKNNPRDKDKKKAAKKSKKRNR